MTVWAIHTTPHLLHYPAWPQCTQNTEPSLPLFLSSFPLSSLLSVTIHWFSYVAGTWAGHRSGTACFRWFLKFKILYSECEFVKGKLLWEWTLQTSLGSKVKLAYGDGRNRRKSYPWFNANSPQLPTHSHYYETIYWKHKTTHHKCLHFCAMKMPYLCDILFAGIFRWATNIPAHCPMLTKHLRIHMFIHCSRARIFYRKLLLHLI